MGLVAAAWQAERRATTSVDRLIRYVDADEVTVLTCPVGVNPFEDDSECGTALTARSTRPLINEMPEVIRTAEVAPIVVALLDPAAANGWGRVSVAYASAGDGAGFPAGRPIIVAGRLPGDDAPNEIVVTERVASEVSLSVGDTVRMAGWTANSGDFTGPPDSVPFDSVVVGVIRTVADVAPSDAIDLTGTLLGEAVYVGPGWSAAHADGLFAYGWGISVKLRDTDVETFSKTLDQLFPNQFFDVSNGSDGKVLPALRRAIATERAAISAFAIVGALAALIALGLGIIRLLRSGSSDARTLAALGTTRNDLQFAHVLGALSVGIPSAGAAAVVCVLLSPFGPLGLARRAEPEVTMRVDATVIVVVIATIVAMSAVVGLVAHRRNDRVPNIRANPRLGRMVLPFGAAPRVGFTFARGGSARAALVVAAVTIASIVAAAGVVGSFDRVQREPIRYGAWWDLVVGDYADESELAVGVELVRSNPTVDVAAYVLDFDARINGVPTRVITNFAVVGEIPSTASLGRMATRDSEITLGQTLARELGVSIGDVVEVESDDSLDPPRNMTVVGIAVLNDPISLDIGAGELGYVVAGAIGSLEGSAGQSILVRFDQLADHASALRSTLDNFDASVIAATPQSDFRNLERIKSVPWFIAGLLTLLALATFALAMTAMMQRHRTDIAVLAAMGMTLGQRLVAALAASLLLIITSCWVGVAAGVIGGRSLWSVLADRSGIPSGPVVEALPIVLVVLGAVAFAIVMATGAFAWSSRRTPAEVLRDE